MNKVQTAAHMEGQQLWTDLTKANKEIKRLQSRIELLEAVVEALYEDDCSCEMGQRLRDALAAAEDKT